MRYWKRPLSSFGQICFQTLTSLHPPHHDDVCRTECGNCVKILSFCSERASAVSEVLSWRLTTSLPQAILFCALPWSLKRSVALLARPVIALLLMVSQQSLYLHCGRIIDISKLKCEMVPVFFLFHWRLTLVHGGTGHGTGLKRYASDDQLILPIRANGSGLISTISPPCTMLPKYRATGGWIYLVPWQTTSRQSLSGEVENLSWHVLVKVCVFNSNRPVQLLY